MRGQTIPGAARFLQRRARHHDARAGAHHGAVLDHDRGGRPQGGARSSRRTRSTSSRSGSTPGTASTRSCTPEIYGAIIDEAHKRGLRVTAHIFDLEDAKGLIRAGIDAFAHGVRDRDIDDELVAMFKQRPNLVLTPNLPDRGVKVDLSWLRAGLPADEFAKLEAGEHRPAGGAGRSTASRRATWRS